MITLLKSNIPKFSHVVHLADCHIRLNQRHLEYREVFSRLYEDIKNLPSTAAIVIVGDTLHSKVDLSPECIQMTKEFLVNLANLRPTVIVAGQHDAILSNKNRLDSLSPIIEAINHPNLFYLKSSGLYGMGNILFNNMSIFDDSDKYILGKDIPAIYRNQYEHIIALFHGTVDGAFIDTGYKLSNPLIMTPLFADHHLALLGDIHTAQDMTIDNDEVIIPESKLDKYNMDLWEIIEEID